MGLKVFDTPHLDIVSGPCITTTPAFARRDPELTKDILRIARAAAALPARSLIIDAEIVARDPDGRPNFHALHFKRVHALDLCAWCFDLLHLDGIDIRDMPLEDRKLRLQTLLPAAATSTLAYSAAFDDGNKLLAAAADMRLEGIVSKRRAAPYRSGHRSDWIKVKCAQWKHDNADRWRMFQRGISK